MVKRRQEDEDSEKSDVKDLDELINRFFGNFHKLRNIGSINPKEHQHSITYRFGTGMDKPEIRVNGKQVEGEELNDFVKKMGPNVNIKPSRIILGSKDGIQELDIRDLDLPQNPDPSAIDYEDTYFEIEHDGNERIVTIELPSVRKDQIFITQTGNTVTIIGNNENTAYKAEFQLDFKYERELLEIDGKNSVYRIRFRGE